MPSTNSVDNSEYVAFVRRAIKGLARRIGEGDVEALPDLVDLHQLIDEQLQVAVDGLRTPDAHGDRYSYGEIAARLGVSRQAVRQRYGKAGA